MKFKVAALTFILLTVSLTPANSIINGTPAVGSDYVVAILFGDEKPSMHCTGAYLRPRVVVTAAHCVIAGGARAPQLTRPIEDWYVQQPGVDWQSAGTYSSRVKVLKIWTDPDYFNRWEPDKGLRETQVNDVAFLFLDSELNGPTVSRAANREEIEGFRLGQGRAFHLGYGCIGTSSDQRRGNDGKPYLSEEMVGTSGGSLSTPIWDRFLLAQYPAKAESCPGDSGSPLLMKKGSEVLYLGTIFAGGNGAAGEGFAATTVLWPFVPALDEAYKQFLIEDAKNKELKAKQEADAKAAAELKVKQEADAKADAELKVKQESDAKAAAADNASEVISSKLKSDLNSDSTKLSNLIDKLLKNAPPGFNKNELVSLKSTLNTLTLEFNRGFLFEGALLNMYKDDLATLNLKYSKIYSALNKKTTVTCVKGKLIKKVTAVKPVCPKGYRKKA